MAFMGKCNTVHPGKRNLKHRHPKGGRILESSNAGGDLRVKLDMNLQYDLTAWPASAVVLFREGCIWEREGRSPSCQGSDHTRSWVSGHWEGTENKNELRKERVGWYGVSMGRNAIKTPTPHFLKVSGTNKVLFALDQNQLGVTAVCLLAGLRTVLMWATRCLLPESQEVWASLPSAGRSLTPLRACRPLGQDVLGLCQTKQQHSHSSCRLARGRWGLLPHRTLRLGPWAAPHALRCPSRSWEQ